MKSFDKKDSFLKSREVALKKNLRNDLFVISKLINDNEKILDVGCGTGNLVDFLLKTK